MGNKIDIIQPRNANELTTAPKVFTYKEAYILDETKFGILKSRDTNYSDWATRTFFIFLGSLITLLAKITEKVINSNPITFSNGIKKWEVWFCILSFVTYLILKILDKSNKKSKRKKLVTEIEEHFEKNASIIRVES